MDKNIIHLPGMPDPDANLPKDFFNHADKDAPRVHRILNVSMSVQLIYFIKTHNVVATAGFIPERDTFCAALVHKETHKVIVNTQPVFKDKKKALAFGEQLIEEARKTKLS